MSSSFENLQTTLAQNVRAARHALAMSQEELAHEAGIDRTYASQIERGIGNPSLRVIFAIAQALEVDLSELLSAKTKMT